MLDMIEGIRPYALYQPAIAVTLNAFSHNL